ncbi:MAG: 6-phosphofructokinase [Phycisphaerae bacterium]|nr:6-phosphofructokinase [Phycisphaerae bacterium]MDD5380961.1 6-phosphofructokinase [Phycisphaerae bacterium]
MKKKRSIAILTGGGDCPGTNAVIRAVAKKAIIELGIEVIGIEDGFEGLINRRWRKLHYEDVSGILTIGGTILGTSNKADPYRFAVGKGKKTQFRDVSKTVIANLKKMGVECLVCIGGDGTLFIANRFHKDGIPIVAVPKTIDNDLRGTDVTFGFDTAVSIATEAIDRVHTTAQSHHRVMIVEVMGRTAGWIALYSGVAGGGDIILIPEIPYNIDSVVSKVKGRNRMGKRFSIVVVSEGAKPKGGEVVIQKIVKNSPEQVRLGGISFVLGHQIEQVTGIETRQVVLGHLQRGGSPTPTDRVLATQLGTKAVELIENRQFGYMAAVKGNDIAAVKLEEIAKGPRNVPLKHPLIITARAVGTCFGD